MLDIDFDPCRPKVGSGMPLSDDQAIDVILGAHTGRIASLNLLEGLRVGQFSRTNLQAALRLWVHYIDFAGKSSDEAAWALGMLPILVHSPPVSYRAPLTPPFEMHIADRQAGGLVAGSQGCSVRDGALVSSWAVMTDFDDDGIDFAARPGTAAYVRLAGTPDAEYDAEVKPGYTITNPAVGDCAVMFYTTADAVEADLAATAFSTRADRVRDRLGLVLHTDDRNLVVVTFDETLAENRPDRGRPTAIDAGGYPRFVCDTGRAGASRGWGQTADLEHCTSRTIIEGHPERVCGRFPPRGKSSVTVRIRFLGSPKLPRGDLPGIGDDDFAAALEDLAKARTPGFVLRDELIALLS